MLAGKGSLFNAICAFTADGIPHVAAANYDSTVLTWNPATGGQPRALTGHHSSVTAICTLTFNDSTHLATISHDRTARIWNPANGTCPLVIPVRDEALSVACADGLLFAGTKTGLLAIQLNPVPPSAPGFEEDALSKPGQAVGSGRKTSTPRPHRDIRWHSHASDNGYR
jgi:WD40 repeat protein